MLNWGSQYAGYEYRTLLNVGEFKSCMSREGNCWDNSAAESFLVVLKEECAVAEF